MVVTRQSRRSRQTRGRAAVRTAFSHPTFFFSPSRRTWHILGNVCSRYHDHQSAGTHGRQRQSDDKKQPATGGGYAPNRRALVTSDALFSATSSCRRLLQPSRRRHLGSLLSVLAEGFGSIFHTLMDKGVELLLAVVAESSSAGETFRQSVVRGRPAPRSKPQPPVEERGRRKAPAIAMDALAPLELAASNSATCSHPRRA